MSIYDQTIVSIDSRIPILTLRNSTTNMIFDDLEEKIVKNEKACNRPLGLGCVCGCTEVFHGFSIKKPYHDDFIEAQSRGDPILDQSRIWASYDCGGFAGKTSRAVHPCVQSWTLYTGRFNHEATCRMGKYGDAELEMIPKYDLYDRDDKKKFTVNNGWVECTYAYDYEYYYNESKSMNEYSSWLIAVSKGIIKENIRNYFIKTNVLYVIAHEFFNQIYSQSYYRRQKSTFTNFDILTEQRMDFLKMVYIPIASRLKQLFPGADMYIPDNYIQFLERSLKFPKVQKVGKVGNNYEMIFSLSYSLYEKIGATEDVQNYLQGFFRDEKGLLSDLKTNQPVRPEPIQISSYRVVNFVYINSDNNIIKSQKILSKDSENFLISIELRAVIENFSIMSVCYAQSIQGGNVVIGTNVPESLMKRVPLIPVSWYEDLCASSSTQECKNLVDNYCKYRYDPPPYTIHYTVSRFLMNSGSDMCACYNNSLAPVSQSSLNNPAAMCFSKTCDNQIRRSLNLTDNKCQNYCDEVRDWNLSDDITKLPANSSRMDWNRYEQICGQNLDPTQPPLFNSDVLVPSLLIILLLTLLFYVIGKYRKVSVLGMSVGIPIASCILIIVAFLASYDLSGKSMCDGKEFICKSKFTDVNLGSSFCNRKLNCECVWNEDCPSSCICASGTCLPRTGQREVEEVSYRNVNYPFYISMSLISIIVCAFLVYFQRQINIGIDKNSFTILCVTICIISIVYLTYQSFRVRKRQQFKGTCEIRKQCVDHEQCEEGERCANGFCCKPSCQGKQSGDSDGCDGICL